jgi:hypothetical protein
MKIYVIEASRNRKIPYISLNLDQDTAENIRILYYLSSISKKHTIKNEIQHPKVFVDAEIQKFNSRLLPDIDQVAQKDCIILSEKAQEVLSSYFLPNGEFIDVDFQDKYKIFYCNSFVSPFVKEETYVSKGNSPIVQIHSFIEEEIASLDVFKSIYDHIRLYFSERVKNAIENSKLRSNLVFRLVWDSEDPNYMNETWSNRLQWERAKEAKDIVYERLDSIE